MRVDGIADTEIEALATNERLRQQVGQEGGFESLTDEECVEVRNAVEFLIAIAKYTN